MIKLEFDLARAEMISANDRLHYQKKGKMTKHLRALGKYQGLQVAKVYHSLPYSEDKPCTVRVVCYAPTARQYDPPNWSPTTKALLDGLTDAGIWTDDNYNIIKETSFSHGGKSGDERWKLVLEIQEEQHD